MNYPTKRSAYWTGWVVGLITGIVLGDLLCVVLYVV